LTLSCVNLDRRATIKRRKGREATVRRYIIAGATVPTNAAAGGVPLWRVAPMATVTTNAAVIEPTTGGKPTRATYYLATAAGTGIGLLVSLVASKVFGLPRDAGDIMWLIVAMLVIDRRLQAKPARRWATSFGLAFLGQGIVGVAFFLILRATRAA
jgi:hypothetical protein